MLYDTKAFHDLSWLPQKEIVIERFDTIGKFIVAAYKGDMNSKLMSHAINCLLLWRLEISGRSHLHGSNALQMHVLRSAFQSGWVWSNTLSAENCPLKSEWGWNMIPEEDRLTLKWTEHKNIPNHFQLTNIIKTCTCNRIRAKCLNCVCGKMKYKCLRFFNCKLICLSRQTVG